ncbi:MAG: cell envelope integrity protein CreD [Parvularculaceae bacterium]
MNLSIAPARSFGLKLMLVGALAFLLWLPCMMIYALVWDRSSRADEVRQEIYASAGGAQTISGPFILVPARVEAGVNSETGAPVRYRTHVAFTPQTLAVTGAATTASRRRGIFEAILFETDLTLKGRFGPLTPINPPKGDITYFWQDARIGIGFASNAALKGVRGKPLLSIDGAAVAASFEPGLFAQGADAVSAAGVSVAVPIVDPSKGFSFDLTMPIAGGGGVRVAPAGEETRVTLTGDWPHPSFQGARLPDERRIGADGFEATWTVPYLARAIPRAFFVNEGFGSFFDAEAFGLDFVSTESPYQSVNRALKYALMFLGIVFLTFFLIEATMGGRAHPAQYILLGLAQVVFYLLVLAFAEHIGFDTAFIGAASATVALCGLYAATVFRSVIKGLLGFIAFAGAYGLIYLLMKSEDYALLIGSVAAFGAVALTMAVTRNLDWYGARLVPKP